MFINSFHIHTKKSKVFVWKSLPTTGTDSRHFEPNTTYLERETCTPVVPSQYFFCHTIEDSQQLEKGCDHGAEVLLVRELPLHSILTTYVHRRQRKVKAKIQTRWGYLRINLAAILQVKLLLNSGRKQLSCKRAARMLCPNVGNPLTQCIAEILPVAPRRSHPLLYHWA